MQLKHGAVNLVKMRRKEMQLEHGAVNLANVRIRKGKI